MQTIHKLRVEQGAALLDTLCPGWTEHINMDTLDLYDPHDCILGQLYGDYDSGAQLLGPTCSMQIIVGVRHGFLCDGLSMGLPTEIIGGLTETKAKAYTRAYQELTDAWKTYIAARRAVRV